MTSTDTLATILAAMGELKDVVEKQNEKLVELNAKLDTVVDNVQAMPSSNAIASASLLDEIEKKLTALSGKITKSTKAIKSSVAVQIGDSDSKELTQTEIKRFLTDSLKVKGDTDLKKALKKAIPLFEEFEKSDDVVNAPTDYKKAQKMTSLIYKDKSRNAEMNKIIMEVRSNQIKNSGEKAQVLVPEVETQEEKNAKK